MFASKQDQMSALIVKVKDALTEVQASLSQPVQGKAYQTACQTLQQRQEQATADFKAFLQAYNETLKNQSATSSGSKGLSAKRKMQVLP